MSSERKMPDDKELEDFLAGLHPVSKAYNEASKDECAPPELDAAILSAARDAVRVRRVTRRPRWVQPVAVAATLAVSLGVLMNLWRDPATRQQMAPTAAESELERAKQASLKEEADTALSESKAEETPAVAPAPASRDAAPRAQAGVPAGAALADEVDRREDFEHSFRRPLEDTEKKSKAFAGTQSEVLAAPPGVPRPEPRRDPAKPGTEAGPESSTRPSTGFVPEPPPAMKAAPAAAAPPPPPFPTTPGLGAQPPSNSVEPSTAGAGAARPEVYDRMDDVPPAAAKDDRQQTHDKLEAMAKERSRRDVDGAAIGSMSAPSAPASRSAPVMPPPADKAVQQESREADSAEDSFATAPPDVWIRRIRDLRERGEEKSARDLLNSFRSRYPDYVLPQDLRAFLVEAR